MVTLICHNCSSESIAGVVQLLLTVFGVMYVIFVIHRKYRIIHTQDLQYIKSLEYRMESNVEHEYERKDKFNNAGNQMNNNPTPSPPPTIPKPPHMVSDMSLQNHVEDKDKEDIDGFDSNDDDGVVLEMKMEERKPEGEDHLLQFKGNLEFDIVVFTEFWDVLTVHTL